MHLCAFRSSVYPPDVRLEIWIVPYYGLCGQISRDRKNMNRSVVNCVWWPTDRLRWTIKEGVKKGKWRKIWSGGSLVDSSTFVVGLNPALAATYTYIGTLAKSYTRSCMLRFGVKPRHSISAVSGTPLSSSGLNSLNEWMKQERKSSLNGLSTGGSIIHVT